MLERQIKTKNYNIQLFEISKSVLYAGFVLEQDKYLHQFNVFDNKHRIITIKQSQNSFWVCNNNQYRMLEANCAIYLPPYSIVPWVLAKGLSQIDSFGLKEEINNFTCHFPFVFSLDNFKIPKSAKDFNNILSKSQRSFYIGYNFDPSVLAMKTKNWINENFRKSCSLTDFSEQNSVPRETMSRAFKQSYGLSPKDYRKLLRMDASMSELIFEKNNVTHAAFNSGYENLGNYYRQFKLAYNTTPKKV